jgi:hypothetical protein
MATRRIDTEKLFQFLREHNKLYVRSSRDNDKGYFLSLFLSLGPFGRKHLAESPDDKIAYFKQRDDEFHRRGYLAHYTCEPRLHLNEFVGPGEGGILYHPENVPLRAHFDQRVQVNTRMIVIDTTNSHASNCAYFKENGFHVIDAPLL